MGDIEQSETRVTVECKFQQKSKRATAPYDKKIKGQRATWGYVCIVTSFMSGCVNCRRASWECRIWFLTVTDILNMIRALEHLSCTVY